MGLRNLLIKVLGGKVSSGKNNTRKKWTPKERKEFGEEMARRARESRKRKAELEELRYKAEKTRLAREVAEEEAKLADVESEYSEPERGSYGDDDIDPVQALADIAIRQLMKDRGGDSNVVDVPEGSKDSLDDY